MMTMPHSPGSGLPGNPGNAPVYPGTVLGNPYADMQPEPQPYAWGLLGSSSVLPDCSSERMSRLARRIPLSELSLRSVSLSSSG